MTYTDEEIKSAKKVVRDFYDGQSNIGKFNRAIELFNNLYPNGTFEMLKKWASGKEVK